MEAKDFVTDLQKWGLTQAQIAERSGVPQPTISKIARGSVDDVLSRNYRSLEAVHKEEAARRADKDKADGTQPAVARASPRHQPHRESPTRQRGDKPSNRKGR